MGYTKKEVPQDYMHRWQHLANLMAQAADVPAALVTRVWPEQIEVLVSSVGEANPFKAEEMSDLGIGLYCETVMSTREPLMVPNALEDPEWADNPDVELNMIAYLGLPLIWPDDSLFGSICIFDSNAHVYSTETQGLLWQLKEAIEADFRVICRLEDEAVAQQRSNRFATAAAQRLGDVTPP